MSLPINQVLCGDCLSVMREWSGESVDMVMFSPPYYGLRDYGVESVVVWGGRPECEHEWGKDIWQHQRGQPEGQTAQVHHAKTMTTHIHQGNICSKCGAWRGQLGLEPTWQQYIEHMTLICSELKRVLKKTGSMYVVIGDTYAGAGQGHKISEQRETYKKYSKDLNFPFNRPTTKVEGYESKCLMGIPWRLAFSLIQDGWTLRNDIIWHKPNHMPSSVKDRLTNAYEHIFHFVQARKYYYDLDAIRTPHRSDSLKRDRYGYKEAVKGRYQVPWEKRKGLTTPSMLNPRGKNPSDVIGKFAIGDGYRQGMNRDETAFSEQLKNPLDKHELVDYLRKCKGSLSYAEIDQKLGYDGDCSSHWFTYPESKHGFSYPSPQDWMRLKKLLGFDSRFDKAMTETILVPQQVQTHPRGRNPSDYWSITTKPFPEAHFAVYPQKLCRRPILSSCPPNGIVLDPMCGSGTTLIVAQKLGRQWIGIDINPDYVEMAKQRLRKECSQKLVKWQE